MTLRLIDRTWDSPRAAIRLPVRTLVVLTSWMWIPAALALAVFAGAPVVGLGVAIFAREVRIPFRALWALTVPTYIAFYVTIHDSFVSNAADAYERRQAADMAPLYGFIANAVTALLLAVALAVLFVSPATTALRRSRGVERRPQAGRGSLPRSRPRSASGSRSTLRTPTSS